MVSSQPQRTESRSSAAPTPASTATPTQVRGSESPSPSAAAQSPTGPRQSQRAEASTPASASRDGYRPSYVSTRIPGSSRSPRTPHLPRQIALSSPSSIPSTPDITADSISSVLDRSLSFSPQTPQTPLLSRLSPATSSAGPASASRRGPRYHHSSDTPLHLRASPAFPALPFTFDGPKQQRVRFLPDSQSNTRSMPKLSNNSPIPPASSRPRPALPATFRDEAQRQQEVANSPDGRPTQQQPRSRSRGSRRASADISADAARSPSTTTWQRRVAEEMVRLSIANFSSTAAAPSSGKSSSRSRRRHSVNTSADLTDAIGKSTSRPIVVGPQQPLLPFPKADVDSSDGAKSNRPKSSSRRAKENLRHQKLEEMFANVASEPVQVHVAQQDEETHPDPHALSSEAPWQLQLDIPTPSLGLSQTPGSDGPIRFLSKKDSDSSAKDDASDSNGIGPIRRQSQRRRPRPTSGRRPKPATPPSPKAELEAGPSSSPRVRTPVHSASSPSLRARARATSATSRQTTTPVRPSASFSNVNLAVPPQTPPRSSERSPVTAGSSPGDSPTPSRHRLSSYALDPRSLFFTPRADPPEGYGVQALPPLPQPQPSPSKPPSSRPTSSYFTAQQTATSSSAGGTPRAPSMSISNQPPPPPPPMTDDTPSSVKKGKGKRVFPDDDEENDIMDVPPLPETPAPSTSLLPTPFPAQRQRLESTMTNTTDGNDVLGDLPVNPRKRLKLSSSAALVQSLADAAAAHEDRPSSRQEGEIEVRGILRPGSAPPDEDERNASRASSRRSHSRSVSFTAVSRSSPTRSRRSRSLSGATAQNQRNSIPFLAFIAPRPVSLVSPGGGRNGAPTYHLREPRRYRESNATDPRSPTSSVTVGGPARSVSDVQSQVSPPVSVAASVKGLPPQGWAFFLGFVFPFSWWIAAFWPIRDSVGVDGEHGVQDVQVVREKYTWRRRCRLIAVFSILIYVPVIVLAVVFGR